MSAVTSSQPPSLLFGQRSPSPPPFSSPPQSPNHLHRTQTPMASPPPQTVEDIDMSTSTTLPTTQGQNHDREDAVMEDHEGLTNGNVDPPVETRRDSAPQVAVEVAAVDEDAMDTTPDTSLAEVIRNGAIDASTAAQVNSSSPVLDGTDGHPPSDGIQEPVPPDAAENEENLAPIPPPPSFDPQDPNAPPPPTEQPPPVEAAPTDDDSSDDEGGQPWQPIIEDTSTPDEQELKEIEDIGGEYSALDHAHWEEKAFPPLDEPEYAPGESGRIEWLIEHYNGTKEHPNKELVMKSPPTRVAGYDWQIKFYPKGNDSDYLSIYVECLSVADKARKEAGGGATGSDQKPEDATATDDAMPTDSTETEPVEAQHAPLPLLDSKPIPKRRSVAAQVSVVLYNPEEPRENHSRTCLHRFCTGSPDWGWTRFHGPVYDIQHRLRGHRAALLRNDKLAFTAYIRVVHDETGCLWEHHSRDNPWDSFAMTGLLSMSLPDDRGNSPGGNLISAIASWMLFKPFRLFLYQLKVPDIEKEPFVRPKPLLAAFQKLLYLLRTHTEKAESVILDDVVDALDWYGITSVIDKYDVIEVWEVFRCKFEEELQDTPYASILEDLLGSKKDYRSGIPGYRVAIKGIADLQEAVTASTSALHPAQALPQLLTLELERQQFNTGSKAWVKLTKKVALNDQLKVRGTDYTLFGLVVHKDNLQSYLYHPVLRPEGPGSKWYNYTDGRDENLVRCLTNQQVKAYEGVPGSDSQTGRDSVAYIAMYVRNDVAATAFKHDPEAEKWDVPEWLVNEVAKDIAARAPPPPPPAIPSEPAAEQADTEGEKPDEAKPEEPPATVYHFNAVESKAFLDHEGSGTFDAYDSKWQSGNSPFVHSIDLLSTNSCEDVRKKIASVFQDIKDPRQIKYWFLDALRGTIYRPNLLSPGQLEYSSTGNDYENDQSGTWDLKQIQDNWTCSWIWVHIIDFDKLPELPKEEPTPEPPAPEASSSTSQATPQDTSDPVPDESQAPAAADISQENEDTPMSEADEPEPPPGAQTQGEDQPPAPAEESEQPNLTMEVEVAVAVAVEVPTTVEPPAVDVVVAAPPQHGDTEMGGTQEDLPPPPPPAESQNPPPPPPPAPYVPPDEIYFFLKFFDAEKQTLTSRGSHYALKSARVDTTVLFLLDLPPDTTLELHEEQELNKTHHLRLRRSFSQNDLQNTSIIIAMRPVSDELRSNLASRCAFADPQSYLGYLANIRNFGEWLTGHFTFDYFSSQYYKGEMKNAYRHGHGTRIYHSGATYTGSFRLNKRHGHGLYTYQNGDTYDGDWVDNQQHGTGTFVEASTGNTYVGGWKNDKKFGEGVTHWKNAQETERLCRICWEDEADAAFYDCGHVVACLGCARRVDSCPVCRKRVLSAMKLYYVAA